MFCTNCGKQIPDEALFCPHCGTKCAVPAADSLQAAPVRPEPIRPEPIQPEPIQPEPQPILPPDAGQSWQQAAPEEPSWQNPEAPRQAEPVQQSWGEPQPLEARKRSPKKGLLIGLGCAALAALIGGGIWFLTRGGNPAQKLLQAAKNSAEELKAYTEDLPNLHSILENVEKLSDSQTMHVNVESGNSVRFGSGDQQYINTGVKVEADLDKAGKRVQASGTYSVQGVEIPFQFYLDETQFQAGSTALLEEGEAISLPLKELPQQWNASALAKLTNLQLPEDLDLSNLKEADLETGLKNAYGEDWTTFAQSVEVIRYKGTPHFTDKGTTYSLSWDREALKRMADKTGELDMEALIDIEEFEDLQNLDLSDLGAKVVIYVLGQCNEHVKDVQFFVAKDKLLGVYLLAEDEGENEELELRLAGEQNPWEHIVCTVAANEAGTKDTDTLDITLEKTEGQLRLNVNTKHTDGKEEDFNWEEGPYTLIYKDADGSIRYEEEGEDMTGDVDLRLVPADGGFRFSAEANFDSDGGYSMKTSYAYALSGKAGGIAPLSAQPIELLKLTEQELQDLILRIQQKAQSLNP